MDEPKAKADDKPKSARGWLKAIKDAEKAFADYQAKGAEGEPLSRAVVRERAQEHVKNVSAKLPHFKRVKVLHLWDHELPRTATRKVKRRPSPQWPKPLLAPLNALQRLFASLAAPKRCN